MSILQKLIYHQKYVIIDISSVEGYRRSLPRTQFGEGMDFTYKNKKGGGCSG
jgi:hypothetical protein